jgi:hypothetical protein
MLTAIMPSWSAVALDCAAEQPKPALLTTILDLDAGRGQRLGNRVAGIGLSRSQAMTIGARRRLRLISPPAPSGDPRAAPPAPRDDPCERKRAPARCLCPPRHR